MSRLKYTQYTNSVDKVNMIQAYHVLETHSGCLHMLTYKHTHKRSVCTFCRYLKTVDVNDVVDCRILPIHPHPVMVGFSPPAGTGGITRVSDDIDR